MSEHFADSTDVTDCLRIYLPTSTPENICQTDDLTAIQNFWENVIPVKKYNELRLLKCEVCVELEDVLNTGKHSPVVFGDTKEVPSCLKCGDSAYACFTLCEKCSKEAKLCISCGKNSNVTSCVMDYSLFRW